MSEALPPDHDPTISEYGYCEDALAIAGITQSVTVQCEPRLLTEALHDAPNELLQRITLPSPRSYLELRHTPPYSYIEPWSLAWGVVPLAGPNKADSLLLRLLMRREDVPFSPWRAVVASAAGLYIAFDTRSTQAVPFEAQRSADGGAYSVTPLTGTQAGAALDELRVARRALGAQ